MLEYIEIEDPMTLAQFNNDLSAKLKQTLRYNEIRMIGWPAGRFQTKVRFLSTDGDGVLWWFSVLSPDRRLVRNLFGHGRPRSNNSLYIDVRFNLPVVKFSRASGGAFLRHAPTDAITRAHRGRATIGHARVPKSALFTEMSARRRQADTDGGIREFLLIGELESPALVADIDAFSSELRRAAKAIAGSKLD